MNVFVYQAALLCAACGMARRVDLATAGKAPADPRDESSYDSDAYPKGPYPNGGGEADTPQHCDYCGEFLCNDLTGDGATYVRTLAKEFETRPDMSWAEIADAADAGGKPALADWCRYYFAPGL